MMLLYQTALFSLITFSVHIAAQGLRDIDPEDDEWSFLETNPGSTPQGHRITEGDIAVDPDERSMVQSDSKKWPLEVKYTLSDDVDSDAVRSGLQYLMDNTCLTFSEFSSEISLEESHLQFVAGSGCWSYVGKLSRHGQSVNIGPNCGKLKVVVHEIMHALGFYHEQCRSDRDNYVEIFMENVLEGKEGNFNKKTEDRNFSIPYDYTSAMHYGMNAFTKNNIRTIGVLDYRYEDILGKGGPSHNDLKLINSAYDCASHCSGECYNNGFKNSNCECVCPQGTGGDHCENIIGTYYPQVCHHVITEASTLESPGYPNQLIDTCFYKIIAPVGQTIRLTFIEAEISGRNNKGQCKKDSIGLRFMKVDIDDVIGCGSEFQGRIFNSTNNIALIKYKSTKTRYIGFQANIEFV